RGIIKWEGGGGGGGVGVGFGLSLVGGELGYHTSTPSEDFTSPRVKFMCSYGGKILPRPGDGRLRYVGGDTRIITVNRDINHAELVLKMTEAYNQHDLTIKYQLPDEDLDALISISSDEDLVNMMEEYDKIERSDGCARLRVFLFSAVDYDAHKSEFVGDQRNTEQRYVDAVNGVPETGSSRKHLEADVRVPRVHSHGMLTRLSEQHLEGGANARPESQQLPDMALPPLDLQRRGLHQQHPPGGQQQSQVHRAFNGTNYVEQQHGRRVHPYNDQPSRSFRSSNSPPRYRDHQVHSEERFMRPYHQQTSVNSDQLPHEHVYESNSISQTSYPESVARPQLPHYMSQNPYQEGLSVQGRLSRPSSSTNMMALEEEASRALHGIQASSIGMQGAESLTDDEAIPNASSLHNQLLGDGQPGNTQQLLGSGAFNPPAPQQPSSMISGNVELPTSVQLPPVYCSTTAGSAVPAHAPTSVVSPAMREGETVSTTAPPATLLSHGEIAGSAVRKADSLQHEDKASLSQLYATGHLAEDMASSVLGSVTKEVEQIHNDSPEDEKEEWMHISQDPSSMVQAPLVTSPTFAIQDWEKDLAELDSDEDESIQEPLAEEKASAVQISNLETIKNADLEEMRELGSGTFGTVYHGKWRGSDVAIKRIKASCFAGRPSEQERLIADFWREACILGQLHHPNVVAFYGVVRDGPGGTLATVTEYMVNGSLKQVLQKKDRTIDRRKRLLIAMDAAFGMEYLHGKNIVHFDMKCENLLVNMRDPHRPVCKVGDLGLSKVKHQTMVSGGVRGTLPWMAPELLNGNSNMVTEKVDVFSFGIVMWELLTGEEPYANMHYGAIIGGIVNNTLRPKIPSWCDPTWKSLMERCWSADPTDRPSFSVIASELRAMAVAIQPKGHG
ncbi:unnamed protein product, partial [Sphagnum compactum]